MGEALVDLTVGRVELTGRRARSVACEFVSAQIGLQGTVPVRTKLLVFMSRRVDGYQKVSLRFYERTRLLLGSLAQ